MKTTSKIEISKSALENNLNFIYKYLPKNTIFSSVVKGNAYGHGIETYVPLAYDLGVRHFSTFSADEAERVYNSIDGNDFKVMIMGSIFEEHLEWLIQRQIEFFVFNSHTLEKVINISNKLKIFANIHLELETGMNRTGFQTSRISKLVESVKQNKYINLKGICTHLAGSESISNYKRVKYQLHKFTKAKSRIDEIMEVPPQYHALCSAGFLSYPKYKLDLVRIGILQYGFFPSPETHIQFITKNKINSYPLKRVITWKSKVMDIKKVKRGVFVGYGTAYFTNENTTIAHVPVGYSHGFTRGLSNIGKVLIRGQRHGVAGMVNMNMMAVDVSTLDNIEIGDEVIFIGNQGDLEISVSSFSGSSRLVNYELLTRLPQNINRVVTE